MLCIVFLATGSSGTQFLLISIFVSNDLAFVVNGQRIEDGGYALKLIYEIYDLEISLFIVQVSQENTQHRNINNNHET